MPLERISAEEVRARPGAIQELAVRLTDDDANPIAKKSVTFTVTPPGAVLFSGAQYAAVETDAHGIVSVRALINDVGRHVVSVKAPPGDRHHRVQFTVTGTSDTEVVPMGDDILVINGGSGSPTHIPMWPIAAVAIAIMLLGSFIWLFERGLIRASGSGETTRIVERGSGSGVDNVARADAAAARAGVEAAKQELGLAIDTGLAENAAHDQGYVREYTRPVLRQLHQASVTARQVREHVSSADGKPAICGIDPSLPACRE